MSKQSVPSVPARRFFSTTSPFAHLKAKDEKKDPKEDDVVDDDDTDDGVDDEEAKKAKKLKKAKRKVEDDEDAKDEADAGTRAIRLREKSRIKAIVNSEAGLANPAAALHLALSTTLPRHSACKLLGGMNQTVPQGRENLRDRMMGVNAPDVGVDGVQSHAPTGTAGLAAAIILAGQKRRGEA
jgi:hypothetical protein